MCNFYIILQLKVLVAVVVLYWNSESSDFVGDGVLSSAIPYESSSKCSIPCESSSKYSIIPGVLVLGLFSI